MTTKYLKAWWRKSVHEPSIFLLPVYHEETQARCFGQDFFVLQKSLYPHQKSSEGNSCWAHVFVTTGNPETWALVLSATD